MKLSDVKIGMKVKIIHTIAGLHPLNTIGIVSEISDSGEDCIEVTEGKEAWWYESCELDYVENEELKSIIDRINENFLSSPVYGVCVLSKKDWIKIKGYLI